MKPLPSPTFAFFNYFFSRKKYTPLFFSLCFILSVASLTSCSDKNTVKITFTNAEGDVEALQNLIFTFNKDIVPDSLMNIWDSSAYVIFEPHIRGKFKWNSTHDLIFSPSEPLQPCTNYKATVMPTVLSHAKKDFRLGGKTDYMFNTSPLKIEDAQVYWTRNAGNEPVAQLTLHFNYPVSSDEISKHLKIKADDKELKQTALKNEVNSYAVFSLTDAPSSNEDDLKMNLQISAGVKVPGSVSETPAEVEFETVLPSRFKMEVQQVTASISGAEGVADVFTTEEVKEENLKDHITIQPAVKFTVEKNTHGFTITSAEFGVDVSYLLTISGLQGTLGGEMKDAYNEPLLFGELRPSIAFASSKGMYLGSRGAKNIAINLVNVPNVKITIAKIYENNMLQFLRSGSRSDYHWNEDGDSENSYSTFDIDNYGDVVYEKTIPAKSLAKSGNTRLLNFDFIDKIKDKNGIYVLQIQSEDKYWLSASKIISLSDIGLIVKEGKEKVVVFANSLQTMAGVGGLKIKMVSTNNQLMDEVETNTSGIATFIKKDTTFPHYRMGLITAESGNDFNFIYPSATSVSTSRFDVGGKYLSGAKYDAFIYAEREIYRPGETVHLSCIVRNLQWNTPGDLPVTMKFLLPNGKEYKVVKKILNEEGSFEAAIDVPVGMVTGTYSAQVYTGDDVLLASKNISIEEFMPDRIKVTTKITKDELTLKDTLQLNILAENFFGPPAVDRNYEVTCNLSKAFFYSSDFSDYNFSVENTNYTYSSISRNGKTNAQGKAVEKITDYSNYKNSGMLNASLFTTVFDENGRPVNKINFINIYTQDIFYGIKNFDNYVGTNQKLNLQLVACDKKGKAVKNTKAGLKIIKKEWETVIEKVGDRFRYNSQRRERIVVNEMLTLNGATNYAYVPQLSGDYEVRLYIPNTEAYSSQLFYAYGYGSTESTAFEVDNDGTVAISTDKEKYNVGDEAKILFKTPFQGKILVTIEQDNMLEYYTLTTDKKAAELRLKLAPDQVPNVFVSATLIRPNNDGSNPLIVAHGYKNIKIENPANHPKCTIVAALQSRSKTKQNIKIKTLPNSFVTIAVVDEGILSLKNTETPDPYNYFYEPRALGVNSYDIYPYLFPELTIGKMNKGGSGMNMGKRVNPLSNKRVKLVSFWSGIKPTNSFGEYTVPIDIPQFSGDLRIMAVAYKDNKFTNAEAHIKVADPIVISNGLPRFASPNDTLIMPITFSNTTSKSTSGTLKINVTGGMKLISVSSTSVSLKANSENKVEAKILAPSVIGNAQVTIDFTAMGEKFNDVTDITVRPASTLQKRTGGDQAIAGQITNINLVQNFMPNSIASKVIISRSPFVQFTKDLTFLIQYPHGCVEQTTSAAFPQLYYFDLAKAVINKKSSNQNPNENVQYAIKKLESMQLYSGGLSYWLGGDETCPWGSVYAAHFLMEAKKAGFEVDKNALTKLQDYLKDYTKTHPVINYYYNNGQYKSVPDPSIIYALYVLALGGKPQTATMNYYAENFSILNIDEKYMLAATYSLSGNKARYQALLPKAFEGDKADRSTWGYFNSTLKSEALALNAILEADPNNPQIGTMAKHISLQLKDDRYYWNTQERSFALLALGKVSRKMMSATATAQVFVDGKLTNNFAGDDLILNLNNTQHAVKINCTTGKLFYYWETEGISADGSYKQEDNYLKVRRTYYNKAGALLGSNRFVQNDLIVIRVTVSNLTGATIENIAVTDLLPAGFEIENPRVSTVPDLAWIHNNADYAYQDIRDDRITYFTSLTGLQTKDFYYLVRAVGKGTFNQGPVSADAMYAGEYHSYNGAGKVVIR